jgi:predicted DNA-binding mobile mystery protein A
MTAEQLGDRMGITGASVRSIESKERDHGIRLASLEKAAEAMNCTLVYTFVPNQSLEETVVAQANKVLEHQLQNVQQTMSLEAQTVAISESDIEQQLHRILNSRNLWSRA